MINVTLTHQESDKVITGSLLTIKPGHAAEIRIKTLASYLDLETGFYLVKTNNSKFDFRGAIRVIETSDFDSALVLTVH